MPNKYQLLLVTAAIATSLLFSACARPWSIDTPESMITVEERDYGHYAWRAVTTDGLVMAARVEPIGRSGETPSANVDFWKDLFSRMLRDEQGYALLGGEDIQDAAGNDGRLLRFGLDRDDTSHRYEVAIFVTSRYLHLVEVGGTTEAYETHQADIERARASYVAK